MKTGRIIWMSIVVGALTGSLLAQEKPRPKAPPEAPRVQAREKSAVSTVTTNSDLPIIGYIEKRGQTITIKAGPKGPLYSIKDAKGKVLYENVSAEQLRAQAPELHNFLKTAVAGPSGKKGAVDASLGHASR